jgi:hypothetical protein
MLKIGTLSHSWVMRYEAKHGYFKRLAHIICNFQNVCKTLANRNLIRQALAWLRSLPLNLYVDVGKGNSTVVMTHSQFNGLYTNVAYRQLDAFLAKYVHVPATRYGAGYTVIEDLD